MTEKNLLDPKIIKKIHFVGIGGISMSGLAEILLSQGYEISGSDMKASSITDRLQSMGIKFFNGHSSDNIENPDLVIYTAAVKKDNPELVKSQGLGIKTIERSVLLGQIMKQYPFSINVSGTHGKTTTTSMVTMIMMEAGMDPTVHIGGELNAIGGNTKIGGNKYFIAEACEYVESFLKFFPFMGIILNIEADHLDYFKGLDHIKESFLKFARLIPNEGFLIACADDSNVKDLLDKIDCNIITYGINSEDALWQARDINFDENGLGSYTLFKSNEEIGRINLGVPGIHNVSNSLAAAAACFTVGCSIDFVKSGLQKFSGTHRRFELKGFSNDIKVIDDYAHHPSEIVATLNAAKNVPHNKLWCIFQPHTYTRTKALLNDFSNSFSDADYVIVSDIYAAREPDNGEINSLILSEKINEVSPKAKYIKHFEDIANYLHEKASPGDLIITMGAGDIYKVGEIFLKP
ncbi:MAG TPA: UDP-N-acetylmuramate--L-alanine ligase [Pseudobacteroides sp.]|uniref:UDP-N-acetylmuramate--L-alanine ligase n=1 Tax=Pseudobacteroides sp. TaxID=1968840 RepID=UPI002F91DD9B